MFETELDNYKVQSTGADGGHHYVLAQIEYNGIKRRLFATFLNKSDEKNLKENTPIKVKGELVDEGENLDLLLLNTTIEN
ncbi:MAG: hypothetical protein ABJM36_02490 [Algibacter sp.]|uniref:hypothetical protein n=1 Tax=Algibacter sp. TaxID=1872428 RepID=UPI00329788AD